MGRACRGSGRRSVHGRDIDRKGQKVLNMGRNEKTYVVVLRREHNDLIKLREVRDEVVYAWALRRPPTVLPLHKRRPKCEIIVSGCDGG